MSFNLGELIAGGRVPKLDTTAREQIEYIDISLIDSDPNNFYELSGLDELVANIELIGLQQPLRVRANPEDPQRVIIVSGHRRRAAIQKLVEDGREDLTQVPCIREVAAESSAMQELRLIYANSDTRKMSSADLAKQTARVERLLYQLKEEGHEFPGRMRDYVAEACKISKSKLARLKVIRDSLIPYFSKLYNDNVIGESIAYEVAKMPRHHQSFIESHQDLLSVSVRSWALSTAITYARRLAEIDKVSCAGGGVCTNRKGKYSASLKRQNWDSDTVCAKCCSKCDKLISCKYACPGLAGKIKRLKADRKAQAEQERIAQRERDMPVICKIQSYWERFGKARAAADAELKDCWEALGIGCYHGDIDKVMARECLEHEFSSTSDIPYGFVLRRYDAEKMVKLADLLGCSIDYLLCRTDVPQMATQTAQAAPAEGWVPLQYRPGKEMPPKAGQMAVAKFVAPGMDRPMRSVVKWDASARAWTFPQGGTIEVECVGWFPIPDDEEAESNG